ncbi:MAG: hypothetical protein JW754_02770 [Candidatus Aenigmarchaeota archaeon]|nr:hypothetical protein [Candidatus Aenigmarchaeota archaeon]
MKGYQKALLYVGIPAVFSAATWTMFNINSYNRQKSMIIDSYVNAIENGDPFFSIPFFSYGGSYFHDMMETLDAGSGKAVKDFFRGKFNRKITERLMESEKLKERHVETGWYMI